VRQNHMILSRHFTIAFVLFTATWQIMAQRNTSSASTNFAFRISLSAGITNVLVQRKGASVWDWAYDKQDLFVGDRVQTRTNGRVILISPNGTTLRIGEFADLEIQAEPGSSSGLSLMVRRVRLYFFHRGNPTDFKVRTRTTSAAVRGTEFDFEADEDGNTQITVLDGEVVLSNEVSEVLVRNGEQATAVPGHAPTKTAVIEAVNIIQWCLYYPAILDLEDLRFKPETLDALKVSLEHYRAGDLLGALAAYPSARSSVSVAETIYHSALMLSVGNVQESETLLTNLVTSADAPNDSNRNHRLADAIRLLIASVKMQPRQSNNVPELATEWLAESYHRQAQADLKGALEAAYQATVRSPRFGFAWERVAELEFSFARTAPAMEALQKSLELSPRNAQALALRGFTFAARNDLVSAIASFDKALTADNALGNAWLGRGLCRIRRRDVRGGVEDLQTAVVVEPQRAILRSYLGKGFAVLQQDALARHELDFAKGLDRDDPTAWLYSALLNQENNRINEGIQNLEKSQTLNDNRAVYRSRLLLDQDRAVRGANLASIYADAGMADVSVREAAKAVNYDYANYSAHLFLAESYNALRDPTRFNLRNETPWFNEFLLANLLSPVGGTPLSQNISQQEYTRLFDQNSVGLSSSTEYRSDGQIRELASQYGTIGNTSWALDVDYQHNDGVRRNNELDRTEWYTTIKQQLSPQDSVMLLMKYQDYHSGDNFQYYDWRTSAFTNVASVRTNFSFDEYQHPILVGGWHHEWSPGMHTLLFGGRLENEQHVSDRAAPQLLLIQDPAGTIYATDFEPFDVDYHSQLEIYTGELNQILQWNRITLSAGVRFQSGSFETQARLDNPPPGVAPLFDDPAADASSNDNFERLTGYGYLIVEPLDLLWLTAGLAYDDIRYPSNFRQPPISSGEDHRSQLGPKAAVVWSPLPQATLRGVFTRSLGGVSLDESYRLEPTQLAGFPQTFRSLISESVVGSVAAPEYETFGVALDLKFSTRTYVGIQAQRLESDVSRNIGVFLLENGLDPYVPASIKERLDYYENSLVVNLNQLIGEKVALGTSYKFIHAHLHDTLPEVPVSAFASANSTTRSDLHKTSGYILFNHPSGWFARAEGDWYHQNNSGYTPAQPGDDFFQFNLFTGYRFAQRRGDITVGILNLTDQDYHLNPLTVYSELPRERVFYARLSFRF